MDSGASANLLKQKAVPNKVKICKNEIVKLIGISDPAVKSLGSIEIEICGVLTKFHVVENNFPITETELIGNKFLKGNKARLYFDENCLVLQGQKYPFQSNNEVLKITTEEVLAVEGEIKDGCIIQVVEVGEQVKKNSPTLKLKDKSIRESKNYVKGVYRFNKRSKTAKQVISRDET